MRALTLNTFLDNFNSLLLEEKEFAMEIIKKTFAEAEHDAIFKKAKKATENYKKGKVKQGTINELYQDLEND